MRSLLARLGPFTKGLLGAVVGVALVFVVVHLVTLYISILRVIAFINQYAEKIVKLP